MVNPEKVFEDQASIVWQRSSVGSGFSAGKSNLPGNTRDTVVVRIQTPVHLVAHFLGAGPRASMASLVGGRAGVSQAFTLTSS
jgi:hypothetical protein